MLATVVTSTNETPISEMLCKRGWIGQH